MFGLGDKTDAEIDSARNKKIAKYQKQDGSYRQKTSKYNKKRMAYESGRGHGIGSMNVRSNNVSESDVKAARESMLSSKSESEKAYDEMMKAKRELVAKRVADPKRNTIVLFNEKSNGWENVNGQNYQVKKSGRVTDAELRRAKKRVYGSNSPRASDRGHPARVTYPPHPTPRQLNNWERNPGRSDIRGIDAPNTAIITARDSVTIRKSVQQQIGVRSNALKPQEIPTMFYVKSGRVAKIGDIVSLSTGDYRIECVERLPRPGKSGIIGIRRVDDGFYRQVYHQVIGIEFEGY